MPTNDRVIELAQRWLELREQGQAPPLDRFCADARHPELLADVLQLIEDDERLDAIRRGAAQEPDVSHFEFKAGDQIDDKYVLVRPCGKPGGFGEVWVAKTIRQPSTIISVLPDTVALKICKQDAGQSKGEGQALGIMNGVKHRYLVTIFEARLWQGRVVVAMELADGTLLDRRSVQLPDGRRVVPPHELLRYFSHAAEAIDFLNLKLHTIGQEARFLQHNDIKPANILVFGTDPHSAVAKVADFSVVQLREHTSSERRRGGTDAYMAPEALEGRASKYSDQYSLALSYCFLRGGKLPDGHRNGSPDLSMLPDNEARVIGRALLLEPSERFPSCVALVEALTRCIVDPGGEASTVTYVAGPTEQTSAAADDSLTAAERQALQAYRRARAKAGRAEVGRDCRPAGFIPPLVRRREESPVQHDKSATVADKASAGEVVPLPRLLTAAHPRICVQGESAVGKSVLLRWVEMELNSVELPIDMGPAFWSTPLADLKTSQPILYWTLRDLLAGHLPRVRWNTNVEADLDTYLAALVKFRPEMGPWVEDRRGLSPQEREALDQNTFRLDVEGTPWIERPKVEFDTLTPTALRDALPPHIGATLDNVRAEVAGWKKEWANRLLVWCLVGEAQKLTLDQLLDTVAEQVSSAAKMDRPQADAFVRRCRDQGRITLLLDALDQTSRAPSWIDWFLESPDGSVSGNQVILTTRPEATAEHTSRSGSLFRPGDLERDGRWFSAEIVPFDPPRQQLYLGADRFAQVQGKVPDDVLGIPLVLQYLRQLVDDHLIDSCKNRGEIYWQAVAGSRGLVKNEIDTLREKLRKADPPEKLRLETYQANRVLAMLAFEMWRRPDGAANRLKDAAADAVRRKVVERLCAAGESEDEAKDLLRDVRRLNVAADRSVLDESEQVLAFRHRSLAEFYCGLFLARLATVDDQQELRAQGHEGKWYWPLRFAIELPREQHDAAGVLCGSLAALYERPASGAWCTELIWRSWDLMMPCPEGQAAIARFQAEFGQIRTTSPAAARQTADALLSSFLPCPPHPSPQGETFLMGAPDDEEDAAGDERPRHPVRLTPFRMAKYAVTNLQYELFDPSHRQRRWGFPGNYQQREDDDGDCPVVNVSWYDAWVFCRWLGTGFRLPTEAEWEYACRAGEYSTFHFGPTLSLAQANIYDPAPDAEPFGRTSKVGSYESNASHKWHLCDMHGNVWEWCGDWYDPKYYERSPAENPTGPDSGTRRVLRGGSWVNDARIARSAFRNWFSPVDRDNSVGFRVVCSVVGVRTP